MRCSVVFGVTLSILVINFSSSSPAINTAAYYQRCVIACETVAVVHRRPRLQHLPVAALTQAVKPDIGSESRFLPTLPAFDAPVRGGGLPSEYCYAVWHRKTRMVWLPKGEKFFMICLFVLTQLTNVTDRQTDGSSSRHHLVVPRHRRSTLGCRAFSVAGPMAWNALPDDLRDPSLSADNFRKKLKTHLFRNALGHLAH